MKPQQLIAVLFWGLGPIICCAALADGTTVQSKPRIVTAKELHDRTAVIIGELGIPILTATEIEATVEEELSHLDNTKTGLYLLKIEKVAGTKLKNPTTLSFRTWPATNVTVAESPAALEIRLNELHALTREQDANPLLNSGGTLLPPEIRTSLDMQRFKEHYVGSRHRLVVYEVAQFNGLPSDVPKDVPGRGRSAGIPDHNPIYSLVVMAERRL
jgi:hypothetical protein